MTFDPATLNIKFENTYQAISPEFWEACYPAPLEGYFWYKALEESKLEDQFTFYYGVISYEGKQIGIIPCFIHNVPLSLVAPDFVAWPLKQLARVIPQVGYQRTFFIGSVCSDSGTIGLRSGYLLSDFILSITQACEVKARELKAPMIVFKDFEKHDSLNVSNQLKDLSLIHI